MDADSTIPTRRTLLRGVAVGAAAVPVLAACGSDGTATTGGSGETGDTGSTPAPAETPGAALAATADVEIGGALFLEGVVITQPSTGEFFAFDRTCTHSQCPVTDLQDGLIHCNCHNSLFDPSTGENVGGPAPSPLTSIPVTVEGDQIVRG